MKLICKPMVNAIMAYWDEVPKAVYYNVILFINEKKISQKTIERTEMYYTFTGLAAVDGKTTSTILSAGNIASRGWSSSVSPLSKTGYDYYVQIEAVARNGEIIEKSDKVICSVREL